MKKNKMKKRAITLLEIMIVIFLIGLIGSVIGVNMKGSMDKGRAFKTTRAIEQMKDIFELQLANGGVTIDQLIAEPAKYLKRSGMVKDPDRMILDGWNQPFVFSKSGHNKIVIHSGKLVNYERNQNS